MVNSGLPLSAPLAAVDLGSNSFRIEIARIRNGRYLKLDYFKEPVRLGAGLDAHGMLQADAAERGLATLREFSAMLDRYEVAEVRAVATQTLREAKNRNAFLGNAEAALGCPIEVISGREEARLIYAGVSHLQPSTKPRLVVDIGGRSTELVIGQGDVPGPAESFGVGSQSMSARYFPDGRLTAEAFREAQVAAGAEFEEAGNIFTPDRWREALASSGTAGAVSQLLQAHGLTDGRLTPESLAWCIERCLEAGHVDNLRLRGLKDERRPVLPGGLAILYTLMVQFGMPEILPAKAALRQGVIVDLHQRRRARRLSEPLDVRDATVHELQRRFVVDRPQARRVRALALHLQGQLLPEAEVEDRRELGWACDLHEIGMMVSHHDHHRHSAYLLGHVDAPGFSQSQQRRVAELVLGHRGGLRKVEAACARWTFAMQLLCLRLAVLCSHARCDIESPRLQAQLMPNGDVALGWMTVRKGRSAPDLRTQHLLREELAAWAKTECLRVRMID